MADDDPCGRGLQVAEPGSESFLAEEDDGPDALLVSLDRLRFTLDRERSEAPTLAAEILDLPAGLQEERLREDPRFHTWGLCELFLARSAGEEDPATAGRLAGLALTGAEHLDPARHAAPVVEDLRARAWAAQGEARRRQGDFQQAEDALRQAASCLSRGTGDVLVEARLLEFEASLRREQGRTGESAGLFKQAAARYRQIGDQQSCQHALAERESVLRQGSSGNPSRPLV